MPYLIYLSNPPPEQLVLIVLRDITNGLVKIHEGGMIHRDVKMENVLWNGQFKLCDFGSSTNKSFNVIDNNNRYDIQEDIDANTTPWYRAPEVIDLYSNYGINSKMDMFALGVMLFIFCFQKPPFEQGLGAVNNHYFIPESHNYSKELIGIMEWLFTPNPQKRPSAREVKARIEQSWSQIPSQWRTVEYQQQNPNFSKHFNTVENVYNKQVEQPLGIFDSIKRYFYTLSKKTEAWVVQAAEDNDQPARFEDFQSLVIKAWLKKDKIIKFNIAVKEKILREQAGKQRVILKILSVIHNYVKLGPKEVILQKQEPSLRQLLNSLTIHTNPNIKAYSSLLVQKIDLCTKYSNLFEANYSLDPLFQIFENSQPFAPPSFKLLNDLTDYWAKANATLAALKVDVHSKLHVSIVLSLIDEIYLLLSLTLHLYYTVKQSSNFIVVPIDSDKLTQTFLLFEDKLKDHFNNSAQLFESYRGKIKNAQVFELIPRLSLGVVEFIEKTPFLQDEPDKQSFTIFKYLNPSADIKGIKLPLKYRPNLENVKQREIFQMNEFNQSEKKQKGQQEVKQEFKQNSEWSQQDAFMNSNNQQADPFGFASFNSSNSKTYVQSQAFFSNFKVEQQEQQSEVLQKINQNQIVSWEEQVKGKQEQSEVMVVRESTQKKICFNPVEELPSRENNEESEIIYKKENARVEVKQADLIQFDDDDEEPEVGQRNEYQSQPIQQNKQSDLLDLNEYKTLQHPPSETNLLDLKLYPDAQHVQIPFEQIQLQSSLHQSTFSEVHLGVYNKETVIIKHYFEIDKELERELQTYYQLPKHGNIVTLIGISYANSGAYLIMEYCQGGTLFDLLYKRTYVDLDWSRRQRLIRDIALAVRHLHSQPQPIIHRDLKSLKYLVPPISIIFQCAAVRGPDCQDRRFRGIEGQIEQLDDFPSGHLRT